MRFKSFHGRIIDTDKKPLLMGILNVTPDSFYRGSRVLGRVEEVARKMMDEGADILDIGGESTRPGAEPVDPDEELRRVIPAIKTIRKFSNVLISIDTYKAEVAEEAIKAGADLINDISGFGFDPKILDVASKYSSPYILMHIKGTPRDMQKNPYYNDVISELLSYFENKIEILLNKGIEQIIVDPGIGFGKRFEDNIEILRNIDRFKKFGYPILVGHSRKSFIGSILNEKDPGKRLFGTLGITAYLALKEVDILRVHDVKANRDVISTLRALL